MINRRSVLLKLYKSSDVFFLFISLLVVIVALSAEFSFDTFVDSFEMNQIGEIISRNILLLSLSAIIWHFIFTLNNLYESKRFSSKFNEAIDIVKATSIGSALIFGLAVLLHPEFRTVGFIVGLFLASSAITITNRMVLRIILKQFRKRGRNLRHVLIVGTNRRAAAFAEKIRQTPELGYVILGFMDTEWTESPSFPSGECSPVFDLSAFPAFIRDHIVDEVAIFLPIKSFYEQTCHLISLCEEQGISVRILTELFDVKKGRIKAESFEEFSALTVSTGAMQGKNVWFKRCFDFLVSMIALILISPVFLIAAVLIKVTSKGGVLFVQERLGYNKRVFRMYKFRTMVKGADLEQDRLEMLNEAEGPVFKIRNDPRITPMGNILRKTSIDELPQLFNVLKGDMSLVGPRPLPLRDYNGFDKDWHRRRFSVRPGMTCLWQINGRHDVAFEKWMELDMQYIDQWSFGLDMKILLKTIPAVFKGSGAM